MPSCSGPKLSGPSADFLNDPRLTMLSVIVRYSLFEDLLQTLLAFLGVEIVNRLNTERLDVAVR